MRRRWLSLLLGLALAAGVACAQSPALFCVASSNPPIVHAEGLAEPLGDVLLACSGGTPGTVVTAVFTVFLTVPLGSRLTAGTLDAILTFDTGSGPTPAGPPRLGGNDSLFFPQITFTVPASGIVTIRIQNLRGAIYQGAISASPVSATLTVYANNSIVVNTSTVLVGVPQRSLLATFSSAGVRCTGSPVPGIIRMTDLFATGTRFFSTRVTEGFVTAFQKKDPLSDHGTRIILKLSDFPPAARLFVPDVVAGSDAVKPTAGGDLGVVQSGGQYAPGGGSLLLSRVEGADSSGAGGQPVYFPASPGTGTVIFNSAAEILLSSGSGYVVYEVMDSNPSVRQSAQFPTFLGLKPDANGVGTLAKAELYLAPLSTIGTPTEGAPVPRFAAVTPASDCPALQDCDASYFPQLVVTGQQLVYNAVEGAAPQIRYTQVLNGGGGFLNWSLSVTYKSGSNWVRVDPQYGINNATLIVQVVPGTLKAGTYEATMTVDAGPLAGSRAVQVLLVIREFGPGPPPPPPQIIVTSVGNLAKPDSTTLAPGSLAVIQGAGFMTAADIVVTFDGLAAQVLQRTAERLEVVVPAFLGLRKVSQLRVAVGTQASDPRVLDIAETAPAIFPNGVLNQDYSVNSTTNGALVGSVLQIFSTGLISPTSGQVIAKIHDRFPAPLYAGPAPGFVGIDQVNIPIPDDLPAMTTSVLVCGTPSAAPSDRVCSYPAPVTLIRRD